MRTAAGKERATRGDRASVEVARRRWLMLLHQIPAKPDYLRVKVWRRMQKIGAVTIKNSAWVLPASEEALEDFQWLIGEIEADGGEALVCETRFLTGLTADQIRILAKVPMTPNAATAMPTQAHAPDPTSAPPRGSVWVTRRGVYVDRIASAWLIRRFIDPEARFRFVPHRGYEPSPGEIRFDMYEAEYGHLGDSCTFEVLASTFVPGDAAIAALAEIVHDIDLKETRFGRPETAGVQLAVDGIAAAHASDPVRLERGAELFESLYAAFAARHDRGDPP
jgi:hypothetical protein